ncbi:hypothetical protein [Taibaiella koreensis]|uniref:hypothetical protein n=1 Tax=Taibaiella koreensis TaxID=1268548 RepID=UPI000E59E213|nr:hypothetical protein [Taibaiella koreensis]
MKKQNQQGKLRLNKKKITLLTGTDTTKGGAETRGENFCVRTVQETCMASCGAFTCIITHSPNCAPVKTKVNCAQLTELRCIG